MTANLINQLTNDFRGGPVSSVASALGESPAKIQAAIGGVLAALTGTLASKASTKSGANDLLDLIRQNGLDSGHYGDVAGAIASPDGIARLSSTGQPLLEPVLGDRSNSIVDWVSSLASVPRSVSNSLLSLTLPIVLGTIGRRVSSAGWSVSSLMNLMAGQSLQPAPAGLAAILGTPESGYRLMVNSYDPNTYDPAPQTRPIVGTYDPEKRTGVHLWKFALAIVLLLGLLGYLVSRQPVPAPRVTVPVIKAPSAALGAFVNRTLKNSVTLNVPSEGIESKLIAFIEDPLRRVDNQTWFSFDRLEFETASATLGPSSNEQLRNIAEILKAYPKVHVKIGGYTDNVGDDAHNLILSGDRASNTMKEIVALGIDKSRLTAEGYGKDHPVADNSTEEGRQRNRRIDIRVTKK